MPWNRGIPTGALPHYHEDFVAYILCFSWEKITMRTTLENTDGKLGSLQACPYDSSEWFILKIPSFIFVNTKDSDSEFLLEHLELRVFTTQI